MTDALDIDGAHPVLNFGSYVELNRFLSRKNLDSLVTTFEHDPESIRGHRLSSRVRIFGPLGVVDCWYAIGGVAVWPPCSPGATLSRVVSSGELCPRSSTAGDHLPVRPSRAQEPAHRSIGGRSYSQRCRSVRSIRYDRAVHRPEAMSRTAWLLSARIVHIGNVISLSVSPRMFDRRFIVAHGFTHGRNLILDTVR